MWRPENKMDLIGFWASARVFLAVGILCLAALSPAGARAEPFPQDKPYSKTMSADAMIHLALVDTLYYRFETWVPRFKDRIQAVEALPQTVETRRELMRLHFYLAGLLAEWSHVLSFTSKFKVDSIKNDFSRHSLKAKELSKGLIEEDLSREQKAEAYFYLGSSEGYVGIIEYGAGHLLNALLNGLHADNHLEEALKLDSHFLDAYVGLGVYQYGNTRLGGLANLLMQGGQDLRLEGIRHIERALEKNILSRPLALKVLIWFYISEEINPDNADLPRSHPLSPAICRKNVVRLMAEYEKDYFGNQAPSDFVGNKGLAMMKAIQFVLDGNYQEARRQFVRVQEIAGHLKKEKGYDINPQLISTVAEGIKFCDLMLASQQAAPSKQVSVCSDINRQIEFIEDGGSMVEYESEKIRGEIQNVFHYRLQEMSRHKNC